MTRISIVTPSLNQGRYIQEAMESVHIQRYPFVEHLIFDGGSTDSTLVTLRQLHGMPGWSHLHWQSRNDGGQSCALNCGFATATGDIIGWLNADDRYRPGCFDRVISAFRRNPDVDVLYGDYALIDASGQIRTVRREIEFSRFILTYHRVLYIPTAATFFRRRIFDDGFRLREHLHYAMDYDLFLRLSDHGYRIQHTPSLLAEFRVHEESKSSRYRGLQLAERRQILYSFSPVIAKKSANAWGRTQLSLFEWTAAAMRYFLKLIHGSYFIGAKRVGCSQEQRCGF